MPRVLLIRGGGLGDFVLTLPLLQAIRDFWPKAWVEVLGHPHIAELSLGRFYVDRVRPLSDASTAALFRPEPPNRELAAYLSDFDWIISFLRDPEATLETNLRHLCRQVILVERPPPGGVHAAEFFLARLRPMGLPPGIPKPRVYLTPDDMRQTRQRLRQRRLDLPAGFIAVHCGSGGRAKNWPAEGFAEVVEALIGRKQNVVLLEGEADRETTERVLSRLRKPLPIVVSGLSVIELASLLTQGRAYLGNDSGVSHLAAAVGTPVVVLFGPTPPEVWRPLGDSVRVVRFEEASVQRLTNLLLGKPAR